MSAGLSSACWPWEAGIARRERKKKETREVRKKRKGKSSSHREKKERKEGANQRGLWGGQPGDCRRRETRQGSGEAGRMGSREMSWGKGRETSKLCLCQLISRAYRVQMAIAHAMASEKV